MNCFIKEDSFVFAFVSSLSEKPVSSLSEKGPVPKRSEEQCKNSMNADEAVPLKN